MNSNRLDYVKCTPVKINKKIIRQFISLKMVTLFKILVQLFNFYTTKFLYLLKSYIFCLQLYSIFNHHNISFFLNHAIIINSYKKITFRSLYTQFIYSSLRKNHLFIELAISLLQINDTILATLMFKVRSANYLLIIAPSTSY